VAAEIRWLSTGPGAAPALGEGGQGIHVEGEGGFRPALGRRRQPVGRLGAKEAGVQGDGGQIEQDAVEQAGEAGRVADRHAGLAGRIDGHQHRGGAAFKVLQDFTVGAGGVGVTDRRAQVPGPGRVAGRQVANGGRGLGVERGDGDAVGRAPDQGVVEGLALEGLLDQRQPVRAGRRREIIGQRKDGRGHALRLLSAMQQ
jgi:hypothetical protein